MLILTSFRIYFSAIITCFTRAFKWGLVNHDEDLIEDEGFGERGQIVQQNLTEVTHVAFLRKAHLCVGKILAQILDEWEYLHGAIDKDLAVH